MNHHIMSTEQSDTAQAAPKRDIAFYATLGMIFVTPLFLIPSTLAPVQFSKTMLVLLLLAVALTALTYQIFRKGVFHHVWSWLHLTVWILPVAYFISALFSAQPSRSFLGYSLEVDTFGFILLAAALVHLASLTLITKGRMIAAFFALLAASWVVFVFQLIQIAFGAPFPFFPNPTANMVGSWNDLGIFAGLVASLTLLAVESLPFSRLHHLLLVATFVVALFFIMLVGFTPAWIAFGLVAFVALVLRVSRGIFTENKESNIRWPGVLPVVGFVAAVFFATIGGGVTSTIQNAFGVDNFDVRPTTQSTINILNSVYAEDPVFGSGPNTFSSQWLLYRSAEVAQSPFWNLSFNAGASRVLSSAATGGLVVALAWLAFLVLLLYTLGRAFFSGITDKRSYTIVSFSALTVLYLLVMHVFYAPSQSLSILLFLFIGVFLASLRGTSLTQNTTLQLKKSPRIGIAFVFGGIVMTLFVFGSVYGVGQKYVSAYYHNHAIVIANQGELAAGLEKLESAIGLSAQDRYYRTAALIHLAQLERIVQSDDSGAEAQSAFQTALAGAVQNAGLALQQNPRSFENIMLRGRVFESAVPLEIDGALENALSVYENARVLNPLSPEIDWRLATLHASEGDIEKARELISTALSKKADYTQAILLLAQIELNAGNLTEAINSVRAAVYFEPQNTLLLYQLGILFLQDNDYENAAAALEESLRLNPEFANAAFFLAQAYAYLDEFEAASDIIERLITVNPDNESLEPIHEALTNNVNPFAQAPVAPNDGEDEEGVEIE
ncbi:MAG: tetratricopeptide repeat protein [Patescibacteria group bacterium UBA2163]